MREGLHALGRSLLSWLWSSPRPPGRHLYAIDESWVAYLMLGCHHSLLYSRVSSLLRLSPLTNRVVLMVLETLELVCVGLDRLLGPDVPLLR